MDDPAVNEADPSPSPSSSTNTTFIATDIGDLAARATFLAFFIILGLVGNTVLIATIAQSNRLKGKVLNLLIINVSVVNLVDCLGNMPLILGSAIREDWDYGKYICRFNAFLMQLVTIAMILGLLFMTTDRFLAAKHPDDYSSRLNKLKANVLIVYTWVHSVAICIPLVLGEVIIVDAFPARYSCSVKAGAPLLYVAFTSVSSIILPFLIISAFYIYIIKVGVEEMLRRNRNKTVQNSELNNEPRVLGEVNASKYVGVLFVLWIVFQGPYVVLTYVEQYRTTSEIESALLLNFSYPWEMELAFTWMKLSYPIFLPLVTFTWKKEVWQRFKNFVLCRKSNLIVDSSPKGSPTRRKPVNSAPKPEAGVPVIFATENGLHVQQYGKREDLDEGEMDNTEYDYTVINGSQILTARKCDIIGSQDFMQIRDEYDTSDYDSQGDADPMSISVRSKKQTTRLRQNSDNAKGDFNGEIVIVADQETESKKRKKKKQKKIQEQQDDETLQDQKDTEKGGHDSGRGSMEERFKKKKRRKKAIEESNVDEKQKESDLNVDCSVQSHEPADATLVIKTEQKVEKFLIGDELQEPDVNRDDQEAAQRVRKTERKKKKSQLKKLAMGQNLNNGKEMNDDTKPRPLPPPRLKPIDGASALALKLNSNAESPELENQSCNQEVKMHIVAEAKQDLDRQSIADPTRLEDNQFMQYPSNVDSVVEPDTMRYRSNSGSVVKPAPRKDRHQRKGTSDSQTTLLGSSASSMEYNEMLVLASKAVSENVHIAPKTPEVYSNSVQYYPKPAVRKSKKVDDNRK